ncbi:hypothetical protein F4802DRAFT_597042 [Xylaria palmicola]|nr:hypothetical protein F4802DRAFT_597042 [Xylaria palmicola]
MYRTNAGIAVRVTTDALHHPNNAGSGFVFGTNERACDILLDEDQTDGVSRTQFAIIANWTARTLVIKNLSTQGTEIRFRASNHVILTSTHVLPEKEVVWISIGTLNFQIVVPDHASCSSSSAHASSFDSNSSYDAEDALEHYFHENPLKNVLPSVSGLETSRPPSSDIVRQDERGMLQESPPPELGGELNEEAAAEDSGYYRELFSVLNAGPPASQSFDQLDPWLKIMTYEEFEQFLQELQDGNVVKDDNLKRSTEERDKKALLETATPFASDRSEGSESSSSKRIRLDE